MRGRLHPQVVEGGKRCLTALRRAHDEAALQEVGLVDVLERGGVLGDGARHGCEPHRAAAERRAERREDAHVHRVQAKGIDLKELERLGRDGEYDKLAVTIHEGRNRQVRRMFEAVGKHIDFLKRLKIGDLTLRGLDRGAVRKLSREEVYYLKNL